MLVKVNTSLAGHGFHYSFGTEVDSEEFSARVGNGWEGLCDPVVKDEDVETAVVDQDSELAIFSPSAERAVVQKVVERRGRRK